MFYHLKTELQWHQRTKEDLTALIMALADKRDKFAHTLVKAFYIFDPVSSFKWKSKADEVHFFFAFHPEEYHREVCNEGIVFGRINKLCSQRQQHQKNKWSIFSLKMCGH